jgi:hypothetical protein
MFKPIEIDRMPKIYKTYLGPLFPFIITISKGCIKILLKKSPAVNMLIWSNKIVSQQNFEKQHCSNFHVPQK